MIKLFWNGISLFGTLGAGLVFIGLAFYLNLSFGVATLINLILITAASNTYKVYRFKPRPDNPEGIRPERPFNPLHVWLFLNPKNIMRYFHYVDAGSFPSIHSARSFNQAALFAGYFGRLDLTLILLAGAALVAWSRVVKLRHDRVDITAGCILGLLTASFTVWLGW